MNDELITKDRINEAKRSKAEAERVLKLAQIALEEQERIQNEERKARQKQDKAELIIQLKLRAEEEKLKREEAEKIQLKRVHDARKIGITDAERKRLLDGLQAKLTALQDEFRIKGSAFRAKTVGKSQSEIKAEIARVRYEMETVRLYIEERGTLDFEIMIEFKTNSAPHPEFIHLRYDDKGELVIWNESQSWQRGSVEVDELGLPTKVYLGGIIAPSYYWKVNLNKALPNSIIRLIVDQYSIEARNQLKCQLDQSKSQLEEQMKSIADLKVKSDQDKATELKLLEETKISYEKQIVKIRADYEAQLDEAKNVYNVTFEDFDKTIIKLSMKIAELEASIESAKLKNRIKAIFKSQ